MADRTLAASNGETPTESPGGKASTEGSGATLRAEALVDPSVSRAKFERELRDYREHEGEYRKRGWILVEDAFPDVFVLMAAATINPSPIIYGIELSFLDYDLRPPALRFVNPFTRIPLTVKQVSRLLKRPEPASVPGDLTGADERPREHDDVPAPSPALAADRRQAFTNLVQGHGDNPAFLCVLNRPGFTGELRC